jgi:hypothetical protein
MTGLEVANLSALALQTTALILSIGLGRKFKMRGYLFFGCAYALMIARRIAAFWRIQEAENHGAAGWVLWIDSAIIPLCSSGCIVVGMICLSVERVGVIGWTRKRSK